MTTIFYDGENLHADLRTISASFPTRVSNPGGKIMVNEKRTMALGISGLLPVEENKKVIFDFAQLVFTNMYMGRLLDKSSVAKYFKNKNIPDDIHFIGITTNRAFLLKDSLLFPQTGAFSAIGAGYAPMIACYYVVRDVSLAFRLTSDIEPMSSAEYESVMADSLNPFVME